MNKTETPLDTLSEIRDLMQKSSRFISLSGLSGISAGVFGLIGAGAVYFKLDQNWSLSNYSEAGFTRSEFIRFCFLDAIVVMMFALVFAAFFTIRKSKRLGQSIWDKTAQRLAISILVPLFTGGMFCIALIYHETYVLVAPAMLVFYGLSLLNASKYTLHDIQYLGVIEILLGIIASFLVGYGLIIWAVGFGVMHIIYGTVMYFKYEK